MLENYDDLKEKSFDVITLWHVLEHIPDLENEIQKINSLLKEDGILIVAVPNYKIVGCPALQTILGSV
ncbi:hypothetical protein CCAN2_1060004 [Capnocytophaga canimorsus]|nr:hypothetical protein CCAN2_1060004 [Capnocytophaga canimorsus]